jgi:uncharacterized membrane protein YedE/YeeE
VTIENFTPVSALIGGLLIGSAATLLLLLNGRIAGVSGIAGGLLATNPGPRRNEIAWRVLFIVGLMIGAAAYGAFMPVTIRIEAPLPVLAVGGLLVGFGTRLGSGCTSGHGVCGIARLSQRSLVATAVFVAAAMITVFLVRHVVGGQP